VVSRAALVDQLRALGVTAGIAVVVHTSCAFGVVAAHLRQDRTVYPCPPDELCDECPAAWASIGA
jgi:hypothetical protein